MAKVPRGAFVPPPTVDSAIIEINNISDTHFRQNNLEIRRFFEIVKAGFAHKRKILRKYLLEVIPEPEISEIWLSKGLEDKIRAEDVASEQWFDIAKGKE